MEWLTTRVIEMEWVGPADFVLSVQSNALWDRSQAGQFAMVRPMAWNSDPLLPRPLSILQAEEGKVSFLVRRVGKGTSLIAELKQGDEISLLGPLGTPFPQHDSSRQWILVGGGVGIAPLLMWARQAQHREGRPTLIYGARAARELVLLDQALSCSKVEVTTEDGTGGTKGLVTDKLAELAAGSNHVPTGTSVLTCGPWAMMERVAEIAEQAGWPCFVSLEARMACGRGICLGCSVPTSDGDFVTVCRQGPVFDASIIDWQGGRGG